MIADPGAFIRQHTRLLAPPHCPEIRLHLADDAVALWEMTEEQLGEIGLDPPFWAFAWAGGQALARYVMDHPGVAAGRRVIDVAAGSGLVAIAAMRAGAQSAAAVDLDPMAEHAVRLNAAANAVSVTATTGDALAEPAACDLILVGDLFYDRDIAVRLLAWLRAAEANGAQVLIGDPGRTYLPKAELAQLAQYEVPVSRALEDAEIKRTGVWRLA